MSDSLRRLIRRYLPITAVVIGWVITSGATSSDRSTAPSRGPPGAGHLITDYGKFPLCFEPNLGQAPIAIKYLARGTGYNLELLQDGLILNVCDGGLEKLATPSAPIHSSPRAAWMQLGLAPVHARVKPRLHAEQRQVSISNYFIGNDRSKWHGNVANYAAVRYQQIYPGIDWVVYGNPQQLEYDFVVAPQADPRRIELRIAGARSISLDSNGDLLFNVQGRTLRQLKPVIYQTTAFGVRHNVDGHYVLAHRHLAFALGDYDHSRQLVIDPTFVYSTYLGGSGGDAAAAIAVDGEGNAYVAGMTFSTDFPTVNPLQTTNHSDSPTYTYNAFVTKFNAAGSELVYSTYLGGSGLDSAQAIAVDSAGNAYVVGATTSTDFPTAAPFQATNHGVLPIGYSSNAFVTKLNPAGSALVYSTYLGGSGLDSAQAIAVDSAGNTCVVGSTTSHDFPTFHPFQATNNNSGSVFGSNAFVTKFNASGSALVYSTYLGGQHRR